MIDNQKKKEKFFGQGAPGVAHQILGGRGGGMGCNDNLLDDSNKVTKNTQLSSVKHAWTDTYSEMCRALTPGKHWVRCGEKLDIC